MALTLLATASASTSSTIEFTSFIDSAYLVYELHMVNVVPTTTGSVIGLRVSTDGGSTWKSGAADYEYVSIQAVNANATGATQINMGALSGNIDMGNAPNRNGAFVATIFCPSNTSTRTQVIIERSTISSATGVADETFTGSYKAVTAVNGLQVMVVNGTTIASGEFKLYGVAAS